MDGAAVGAAATMCTSITTTTSSTTDKTSTTSIGHPSCPIAGALVELVV
jgi:hypothetical protein